MCLRTIHLVYVYAPCISCMSMHHASLCLLEHQCHYLYSLIACVNISTRPLQSNLLISVPLPPFSPSPPSLLSHLSFFDSQAGNPREWRRDPRAAFHHYWCVCVCVYLIVCVCVCVTARICVRGSDSQRVYVCMCECVCVSRCLRRVRQRESARARAREWLCMCVCVCVYVEPGRRLRP